MRVALFGSMFALALVQSACVDSNAGGMGAAESKSAELVATGSSSLLWQDVGGYVAYTNLDGLSVSASGALQSAVPSSLIAWRLAAAADINGDGQPDLVWQNKTTGAIDVWMMAGTSFQSSSAVQDGSDPGLINWTLAAAADINGDGHPDLVWQNRVNGSVCYWLMSGTSVVGSGYFRNGTNPGLVNWRLAAVADINRDGHPDLVWQNRVNGSICYWLMSGTGSIGSGYFQNGTNPNLVNWTLAGTADVNADGHPDLLWQSKVSESVAYWLLSGPNLVGSGAFAGHVSPSASGWRLAVGLAPTLTPTAPILGSTPVSYTSFNKATYSRYAWPGRNVALQTTNPGLSGEVVQQILVRLDAAWDYYASVTGRLPNAFSATEFEGLDAITQVPNGETCGAACSYVGTTGTEITDTSFSNLYQAALTNDTYDQAQFYEFGRNFFFYNDKIEYKGADDRGIVGTGYAVLMRFLSMSAASVVGAPFNGVPFATFLQNVERMVDLYVGNPSLNWANTLKIGQAPQNPEGLGATDLFASFIFRLIRVHGNAFIFSLWKDVDLQPNASTTQDAIDNLVVAASKAAAVNLTEVFTQLWRWPLSVSAQSSLLARFGAPVAVARYR